MDLKELRYGVSQLIDNRFGVVITIDDRYIYVVFMRIQNNLKKISAQFQ